MARAMELEHKLELLMSLAVDDRRAPRGPPHREAIA
jgi:hypothetical protein